MDSHRDTAAEWGFNRSSFQSIAQLLPPERMSLHLRTLAELIDEAVASDSDPEATRSAIHKLISVSASLGFDEISMSCRRVEQTIYDGTSSFAVHAQLRRAAEAARPVIELLSARQE